VEDRALIGAVLQDLPGISAITDTRDPDADYGSAAWNDCPFAGAIHVTDNPLKVIQALESGKRLDRTYGKPSIEYGHGGLFVSAAPAIWMGRSRKKWDFIDTMTEPERRRLCEKIFDDLAADRLTRYISQPEFDVAIRELGRFKADPSYQYGLMMTSGQPYNVPVWKASYLEALGISPGKKPLEIPVKLFGRFARFSGAPPRQAVRTLKQTVDGMYAPASFSNEPEMVVWNPDSVVEFGEWKNPGYL